MSNLELILSIYLGVIAAALLTLDLKIIEIKNAMNRIADAMEGDEEDDEDDEVWR